MNIGDGGGVGSDVCVTMLSSNSPISIVLVSVVCELNIVQRFSEKNVFGYLVRGDRNDGNC